MDDDSKYDHFSNEEYFALEYSDAELNARGRHLLDVHNNDRSKVRKLGVATSYDRYGEYFVLRNGDDVIYSWNFIKRSGASAPKLPKALMQKIENDEYGGPVKRFRTRILSVRHTSSEIL